MFAATYVNSTMKIIGTHLFADTVEVTDANVDAQCERLQIIACDSKLVQMVHCGVWLYFKLVGLSTE